MMDFKVRKTSKNKRKNKVVKSIKLFTLLLIIIIIIIVIPKISEEEIIKAKVQYYENTSYQMEDISRTKLYNINNDSYIEVTSLNIADMNDSEYILEVYLENYEVLRYNVNSISYENDDFIIEASHQEIENGVEDVIELDYTQMDIASNISALENAQISSIDGEVNVSTYEEFLSAITNLDANIVFTNDIDFSGYVASSGYIVSGTFTGSIDGKNYAILNTSNTFFEKTEGAILSNLLVKGANISANTKSILVNTMVNTTVENVHINDSVYRATANNGNGPFAGTVTSSNFTNISVTDTILADARFLGGLFGLSYGETNVENAYVQTTIKIYDTYAAGVVTLGYAGSSINISNSIINATLQTNGDLYKGGIYGQSGSGNLDGVLVNITTDADSINKISETLLSSGSITSSGNGVYTVIESGGTSSGFDFEKEISINDINKEFYINDLGLDSSYWNLDNLNEAMANLNSYEEIMDAYNERYPEKEYINVSTAEELIEVIENDNSANINLTDNINFLLYEGYETAMIKDTYSGNLNGNGHFILNLSVALFNSVDGATISNLVIDSANITGRTGIVAGTILNSTIQSVHITNSYIYCTNTTSGVGGFAGAITSVVMDDVSITNSTIKGSKRSGGLAGYSFGVNFLSNIYIDSDTIVTNDSDATGGLIGQNASYVYMIDAIIAPEFNSNGSSNRAGLVGYSSGDLQFVDVVVAVTSTSADSIANAIPILHGSSSSTLGNMYEWSGSNLRKQYDYSYSQLLEDDNVTKSFFVDTLKFRDTWNIYPNTSSSNLPTLASFEEMMDTYTSGLPEISSTLKTVEEYDVLIKQEYKVSENQTLTDEIEYLALLRNLVNNVGYDYLVAYIRSGEEEKEFVEWLIEYENVKMYTEAGEPDGGSYTESIRILYQLYSNYKEDLVNYEDTGKGVTYSEMYHKMMFTLCHTHSTTVGLWVSKSSNNNDPNNSTAMGRYEIYKKMMIADIQNDTEDTAQSASVLDDIFYTLEMEEMRYVMNGIIDDESVEWLEWYVRNKKNDARGGYSLLSYTFGYNYVDSTYYEDETVWDEKYGITQFGLTYSQSYPKQWVVFEEGGVCGAISKSAVNAQTVNGRPATVVSQPGHAAYTYFKTDSNGDHYWGTVDTSLATWAYTGKTEKLWTRMPNGWGNDSVVSGYAASYLFISQAALNDYDNYVESEMELLLAQVYEDDIDALETIYWNTLDKLDINLDAWLALARLFVADESKTDDDKYELLEKMARALVYQPLPLYHTSNIVIPTITDNTVTLKISKLLEETYTTAQNATSAETLEYSGVIGVASYLLGIVDTEVATFSFDGDDAGKVVLNSSYENAETRWYVSIDSGKNWIDAEGISLQLTEEQLGLINEEEGVRIYFSGSDGSELENQYIIDITVGAAPVFSTHSNLSALFANDYENRVIGGSETNMDTIEWYDETTRTWKKIEEQRPDLSGDVTVEVRICATGTKLKSPSTTANFTTNTDPETRKYVSIDRLSIENSSSLYQTSFDIYAIDGTTNTMFHSAAQADNYITIKIEEPIYMTGFEYTPRLSGTNGMIYTGEIYTSLDGEEWTLAKTTNWSANTTTKVVDFEEHMYTQYVKLVSKSSVGNFLSTTMINLFEDTTVQETVELQYSTTDITNEDVTVTLLSDEEHSIDITNNGGENTYTFTQNGDFTFEYTNTMGTEKTITATVENIDKEAPTADIKYETIDGTIIVSLLNISEEIKVTNNSGQTSYTFYENGEFVFNIEDLAGNTNEITAIVENIFYPYIQIGEDKFGDGKTYSKENPFELPKIEYIEDMTYTELLTNDIEIFNNNEELDINEIDINIQLENSTRSITGNYLIEITNNSGFTTYFIREIYIEQEEVDKQELQEKIDEASSIDSNKYTEESINDLNNVLEQAIEILNSENASIEEVEKMVTSLNEAINNLVELEVDEEELPQPEETVDKQELTEKIEEAKSIDTAKYSAQTIAYLNNVLIEANKVLENEDATNEELINAIKEIEEAILNLEEVSSNANLSKIEIDGYTLTPTFSEDILIYSVNVGDIDSFETIDIQTSNENATYDIKGNSNFVEGENIVLITVTAQNGETKVYMIVVEKEIEEEDDEQQEEEENNNSDNQTPEATLSNNANLSYLEVSGATLSPSFNTNTSVYEITVLDVDYLEKISIKTQNSNATYEVIGNYGFKEGKNTLIIKVTAQDGKTVKIYTLYVYKEVTKLTQTSINLSDIEVSNNGDLIKISAKVLDENTNIVTDGKIQLSIYYSNGKEFLSIELDHINGIYEKEVSVEKDKKYIVFLTYTSENKNYAASSVNRNINTNVEEVQQEEIPNQEEDFDDTTSSTPLPQTGTSIIIGVSIVGISVFGFNRYIKIKKAKKTKKN